MLALVTILVAIWFYNAARKAGKRNVWQWVALAVVTYYVVGVTWVYAVLKPLLGRGFQVHSMTTGLAIEISGVLVGLLVLALIRAKLLRRSSDRPDG